MNLHSPTDKRDPIFTMVKNCHLPTSAACSDATLLHGSSASFFSTCSSSSLSLFFLLSFTTELPYDAAIAQRRTNTAPYPPFFICFSPHSTWESCILSCIVCPVPLPQAGSSLPSLAESLLSPHEQGFQAPLMKHLLHILWLIHTLKGTINICLDFLLILLWHSY